MSEYGRVEVKKLGKWVLWTGLNAAFFVVVWYGGFRGVEWAASVALFYAWTAVVIGFVAAPLFFIASLLPQHMQSDPRQWSATPRWLRIATDIVAAVLVAVAGWTVTAVALALHTWVAHTAHVILCRAYEEKAEKAEPATAKETP